MRATLSLLAVAAAALIIVPADMESAPGTFPDDGLVSDSASPAGEELAVEAMQTEPDKVSPGDEVLVWYPDGWPQDPDVAARGMRLYLERMEGDSWELVYHAYWVHPDQRGEDPLPEPRTLPADADRGAHDTQAIGPGPDLIVIPDDAEPGDYRVCTDRSDQQCGPFTVTEE